MQHTIPCSFRRQELERRTSQECLSGELFLYLNRGIKIITNVLSLPDDTFDFVNIEYIIFDK